VTKIHVVDADMHLEAVINQSWRGAWGPWLSELGDALGGHDQSRWEEYLETVELEVIDQEALDQEGIDQEVVDQQVGMAGAEILFIG